MNTAVFNVEQALEGAPIKTREGHPVTDLIRVPANNINSYVLQGKIHNNNISATTSWTINGAFLSDTRISSYDLLME